MSIANDRRRQILSFIQDRVEADGRPPTLEEIAAASGLASRSAAQKHVRALEASGELQVTRRSARSARPKQRKATSPSARQWFEVSARDITELSDIDLRALVARLCISRLAEAALPPSPVTWGGDQNAPDGGIDVRVQLQSEQDVQVTGFPRCLVGIQVKATKMGVSEIQKEMCPAGLLRPSIRELIQRQGAYIIATADSAADSEYKKRISAMRAAAASEPGHQHAEFDYYDAQRLADWTNRHPGVVAWVRSQLGRPLQGWQPYGQWADVLSGKVSPFLPDNKQRLSDPLDREHALRLVEGLHRVRSLLTTGGSAVRLTGLSGVGKTRFAQALFEEAASPNALPSDLAIYTDTAHSPNPSPLALLDELLASRRRAILIVDNCGSQLHNQLAAQCKVSDRVSLLTIEYDIREDLPAGTNVFQLEAASADFIEKVINQQFPEITPVNVRTITEFADGNSRVAIALANTMKSSDSLAGLTDRELFERLFWLGKEVQHELKVAAEVCALVYSFDIEDIQGELTTLATLAGIPAMMLYRRVNELQQRGLAQRRGRWRAILPHAIANTLAREALDAIPISAIQTSLVQPEGRLLRSFSRRLGYLHTSTTAVGIVRGWLNENALLGNVHELSPLLLDVLINVAPVDPEATLQALKRAIESRGVIDLISMRNPAGPRLVKLIRSIAYEPKLFEECLEILLAFALAEEGNIESGSARDVVASLFTLYLSGTHATTKQRANWIQKMLRSNNPQLEIIGFNALCSALESHSISTHYEFEFGARIRDYGMTPTGKAVQDWFKTFIDITVKLAQGTSPLADRARNLLANNFRYLWTNVRMVDAMESATDALQNGGWEKGWLAIRKTIRFDSKDMSADTLIRLRDLEKRVRPQTLVERVKAIVLNAYSTGVDFSDGEDGELGYHRAGELARELGQQVSADPNALAIILPLIVTNIQGKQWMFGAGLADNAPHMLECWTLLTSALAATDKEQRNVQGLRGFLSAAYKRDRGIFERILDDAIKSTLLAEFVPILQLSAPLDDRGCARLLTSMDSQNVSAWDFQHLGLARSTEVLQDHQLANLLQRLSTKPDGKSVVIEILFMHLHDNPEPPGPLVRDLALKLIAEAPLTKNNQHLDHQLGRLIRKFANGSDGELAALRLLTSIRDRMQNLSFSRYDWNETVAALFQSQPFLALDLLVGDGPINDQAHPLRNALAGERGSGALSKIPVDMLVQWCRNGSPNRWTNVAPLVPAFEPNNDSEAVQWSDHVLALLNNASEPASVAKSLIPVIDPMNWSGSRAEAIRRRLPLLDQLAHILGPEHTENVGAWRASVMLVIEREARRDLEEHRARNERFE